MLVFDDDDPPVASLEIKQTQIPSNRPVNMTWNATDDFGLERVVLEIENNGQVKTIVLRKPNENRLKLGAKIQGVSRNWIKGVTAILRLVAYDNQSAFGSETSPEEGEPFGKRGSHHPLRFKSSLHECLLIK